ncbi:MAG: orotidine 5'-phosphate decarboxylase, partial [Oscillospiraceae bacterium]|nr:orotidine 5'-phosphate decarboxylase [Oscillospiraceae bacterium]
GAQGAGGADIAGAFDSGGIGAVINSSRGIMCAYKNGDWDEKDYAQAARAEAIRMRDEINSYIKR